MLFFDIWKNCVSPGSKIFFISAELDNVKGYQTNVEDINQLQQNIAVNLLTDLQELQKAEISAISEKMGKMNSDEVLRLLKHQRNTNINGYFDNLSSLLFKVREEENVEIGLSETQKENAEKALEKEFDDKATKIRKNLGEGVDVDSELQK